MKELKIYYKNTKLPTFQEQPIREFEVVNLTDEKLLELGIDKVSYNDNKPRIVRIEPKKIFNRLKKQYQYLEMNVSILEAVKKAKLIGYIGLVYSNIDKDFYVILEHDYVMVAMEYRTGSNIKNQSKRHNLSNDGKLKVALGNKRAESWNLHARGIKIPRDKK